MKSFYDYNPVSFDIETSDKKGRGSLDERKGIIALMQIKRSPEHEAELLDVLDREQTATIYSDVRKIMSDENNLIIGHNLKFDYKWLVYNGIFPRNVFDTMIASQILYTGILRPDDATKKYEKSKKVYKDTDVEAMFVDMHDFVDYKATKASRFSHSFAACMERELGISVSKAEQQSDWARRPLSPEQIEYALDDVRKIDKLAETLYKKLVAEGLEEVFWLEMEAFHAVAFKEFIGIRVDKEAWKKKAALLSKEVDAEQKVLQKDIGMYLAGEQDRQGLFGLVPVSVNLNSVKMADHLGLPDVQAQTLIDNEDKNPYISKFLKWKGQKKLASTYGKSYLDKIGEDSRLRGEFSQTFTVTGRLSSKNPNLQNIPDYLIKSMIRPSEGMVSLAIDFSTVELRILAYLSGDEKFIAACNSNDMHAQNARTIFDIPEELEVPKQLRKKAKVVSFAVPYGTSAYGLYGRGLTESVEEAQELIDKFYETFPTVAKFLKDNAAQASTLGFTRDAIGRIRRYSLPDRPNNYDSKFEIYKEMKKAIYALGIDFRDVMDLEYDDVVNKYGEDLDIKSVIGSKVAFRMSKEVNSFEKQMAAIKREGQNQPIQSTSASITKRALADVYRYLWNTGYGYLTLSVHDSILYEIRKKYVSQAARDIKRIMEDAGPKIVPNIVTPVDIDAGYMQQFTVVDENGKEKTGYVFNQTMDEDFNLVDKTEEEMMEEIRNQ